MAGINEWYGENNINWGKIYSESWWGSVNEANSWGIIYPATAEGLPSLTGTFISDGFTVTDELLVRWSGDIDHTFFTAGISLRGQAVHTGAGSRTLTLGESKQLAGWFSENTDMTIDVWYDIPSKFRVVETESEPDTILHNMTDATGAQVKYILSPVQGTGYVVLIKGGTHNPKSSGNAQILTVGEVWNDRDIMKYT